MEGLINRGLDSVTDFLRSGTNQRYFCGLKPTPFIAVLLGKELYYHRYLFRLQLLKIFSLMNVEIFIVVCFVCEIYRKDRKKQQQTNKTL